MPFIEYVQKPSSTSQTSSKERSAMTPRDNGDYNGPDDDSEKWVDFDGKEVSGETWRYQAMSRIKSMEARHNSALRYVVGAMMALLFAVVSKLMSLIGLEIK